MPPGSMGVYVLGKGGPQVSPHGSVRKAGMRGIFACV